MGSSILVPSVSFHASERTLVSRGNVLGSQRSIDCQRRFASFAMYFRNMGRMTCTDFFNFFHATIEMGRHAEFYNPFFGN